MNLRPPGYEAEGIFVLSLSSLTVSRKVSILTYYCNYLKGNFSPKKSHTHQISIIFAEKNPENLRVR